MKGNSYFSLLTHSLFTCAISALCRQILLKNIFFCAKTNISVGLLLSLRPQTNEETFDDDEEIPS